MGPLILVSVFLTIYFLPTFVGVSRKVDRQPAIFLLNLFLGWTFVGWVIALVWAVAEKPDPERRDTPPEYPPAERARSAFCIKC